MILDIITALIAGLSITESFIDSLIFTNPEIPINFYGYTSPILSITVGNILKDIQLFFGVLFIFLLYRSSMIVKYGTDKGIIKAKNKTWIIIGTISGLFITLFDIGGVAIYQNYKIQIIYKMDNWSLIGFLLNLALITYASLIVVLEYVKNKYNLDEMTKQRLFEFSLGYLFVVFGLWWWVIGPIFGLDANPIIFQSIGHTFWTLSPILFYRAMHINQKSALEDSDKIRIE
jgi:hypothetical protein